MHNLEYGGYALLIEAVCRRFQDEREAVVVLTPSELAVLAALSAGRSTKHIARDSNRSIHTVHAHVRSAIAKLGCSGRTEALAAARKAGYIS